MKLLEKYLKKIQYTPGDLVDNHLAMSAVIKQDGKILMMDHLKYNFWTIPIGKVDEGQTVEEGLKMELKEELNIVPTKFKQIASFKRTYPRLGKKVTIENKLFLIEKWNGTPKNNEPKKHRSIKYMTIKEIEKLPKTSDATKTMLKVKGRI